MKCSSKPRRADLAVFLNSLARTYDPHSEYLRKEDIDDLDSDMRLSMVGIGVVVESDGRYVKIVSILPGSPAAVDGRIKPNDRILAIAKENGDFVDIGGMGIDHVLALMRSKAGTHLRLKVTASRGTDASERRDIDLVSRNIDLVDDEAKGEVIERQRDDGKKERLGWITIPSFYGDPDNPHGKSLTRDVRNLVMQLKRGTTSLASSSICGTIPAANWRRRWISAGFSWARCRSWRRRTAMAKSMFQRRKAMQFTTARWWCSPTT